MHSCPLIDVVFKFKIVNRLLFTCLNSTSAWKYIYTSVYIACVPAFYSFISIYLNKHFQAALYEVQDKLFECFIFNVL